jgi:NADH-ubiquinone oxidoreductase chain 4
MFFIVSFYGSRQRRIRSAYLLFLYTLFSSLVMFLSILYIFFQFGTTNYLILKTVTFDLFSEKLIWLAFFCVIRSKNAIGSVSYLITRSPLRSANSG